MKLILRLSKKISQGWIVLGIIGVLGCLVAWVQEGFDISPRANLSYIIAIAFFIVAILSGIGAVNKKLWGKALLTFTSIILALYCFLFLGHVWNHFGKLWFAIVWVLFVFAISSIALIWIERKAPTYQSR